MREYGDVIEIFVECFNILKREHSRVRLHWLEAKLRVEEVLIHSLEFKSFSLILRSSNGMKIQATKSAFTSPITQATKMGKLLNGMGTACGGLRRMVRTRQTNPKIARSYLISLKP